MNLRLREPINFLKKYLANPLFAIRIVPDWTFLEIFAFQLGISIALGFLSYIISGVFINLFVFPLSSVLMTLIGAAFFYTLFSALFKRDFDFLKVYMIVFLFHLPFLFLRVI